MNFLTVYPAQVRDYKENITAYLADLSAEIVRRKDAVHAQLGITDASKHTDRELAEMYAQHSGLQARCIEYCCEKR